MKFLRRPIDPPTARCASLRLNRKGVVDVRKEEAVLDVGDVVLPVSRCYAWMHEVVDRAVKDLREWNSRMTASILEK